MSSPPYLGVSGADRPLVEPLGTVGAVHAPAYLLPLVVIVPGDLVPHGLHRIHEVSIGHGAPLSARRYPGFFASVLLVSSRETTAASRSADWKSICFSLRLAYYSMRASLAARISEADSIY